VQGEPATRRLFVALMLGAELGARVSRQVRASLGLRGGEPPPRQLRLVAADDLHLTLFFLGAVATERSAALEAALGAAVEGLEAPRLELGRAGAFPDARRPRILWLGLREPVAGALGALVDAVHRACVGQGFEADPRPFAAHVTAGRVRAERGRQRAPAGVPPGFFELDPGLPWQPGSVALVESAPGGPGPAYRPIRTWPLASRPA